jgi:hypothetical protein
MIGATRTEVSPPVDGRPAEPLDHLADRIRGGAVRLAAATAAWLRLIAEFDEREGWAGVGITSCAHWLAWQCGLTPGTARQHVRVARALRRLPAIETAFAGGELSYSKVRALTRVAEPGTEEELVEFAPRTPCWGTSFPAAACCPPHCPPTGSGWTCSTPCGR